MIRSALLATFFIGLTIGFSVLAENCKPLHYRICEDQSIKGKGKQGECLTYASSLATRLSICGIHGRLVFYSWHIAGSDYNGKQGNGRHVFVNYRLPDGSEWIVDNEHTSPIRIPSGSPLIELVYILGGTNQPVEIELNDSMNKLSFF